MNMLNRNCRKSFVKPEFLKKAQRVNPRLYDIGCYNDNLALMSAPESDETIRLAQESRSKLSVYTTLDESTDLQCDYVDQVVKCKRLENELSKRNTMSKSFEALRQHAINLELALQQYLKAQLQDKGIAISELKKLIERLKGKSVETKFEKPSVIRQPNAFKSQRQSVFGKPTTFSDSLAKTDFSKSKSVTTNNVSNDFSNPVTAQILPQNVKSILKNTNVIALGMYKVHTRPNQTRTSQLPQDIRKTNKRVSFSTGVIPTTSVSRPHLKSNQLKDRVMPNNSQGKKQEVEDHRRKFKCSTMSSTPLSSNSFAARRDNSIHHRLWVLKAHDEKSQAPKYTWTHFLRSKDETPEVLINFLKLVQRGLHAQVKTVRTDKAIATACFTQNLSLVIPRHEKTPYHIINGRKPSVKFFHIFGSLCYIVKDGENLDKMKEKGDACIFVGYSTLSRAYQVYNKRTRVIVETIHVNFDELPLMASDHVSSDIVPQCLTTALEHDSLSPDPQSQENVPHTTETVTTSNELDLLFNTPPLNIQTTPETTSQTPTQAPTVTANENIIQAETNKEYAHVDEEEFINIFSTHVQERGETSSRYVNSSNMHTFYQQHPSEHRWTKDHLLEQVIRNLSQSIRTRRQLETNGEMCMFTLTVSRTEPKNIKEAMADSAWIEEMQEEIHQYIKLPINLYNNLRVFEQELTSTSKSSASAQNVAFVSHSKSSTNKVKSGHTSAYSTCTPTSSNNFQEREAPASFADEVIYSLFAKQFEDLDLLHEDLEQIDDIDIEEMDIN
ncbi:retrovirus-related pol polyprotein from transposon TNT 1-94 [Tanacetum coccineum]